MSVSGENTTASAVDRQPSVAILPVPDRFEDFFDKIGMSLESFRDDLTGGWSFNFVEALQAAGVRPVLYFVSARVPTVVKGGPTVPQVLRSAFSRLRGCIASCRVVAILTRISLPSFRSLLSYVATPWRDLAREFRRDACAAILCQEYEHPRFDEALLVVGRASGGSRYLPPTKEPTCRADALELPFRHLAMRRASGLITGSRWEMQRVRSTYGVSIARMALLPNSPGRRPMAAGEPKRGARRPGNFPWMPSWSCGTAVSSWSIKDWTCFSTPGNVCTLKRSSRPYLLLLVGFGSGFATFCGAG